jgi:hypothetical protein
MHAIEPNQLVMRSRHKTMHMTAASKKTRPVDMNAQLSPMQVDQRGLNLTSDQVSQRVPLDKDEDLNKTEGGLRQNRQQ